MKIKNLLKRHLGLLLALMTTVMSPAINAGDRSGEVIGEARDIKSDELLYREVYCANGNPDEREVIYRNTEGRLIAHKVLDYSSGPVTPSFVQHNLYSSEVIEVGLVAGMVTMSVLDAETAEPKKAKSTPADVKMPVVIDAGFDEFVRMHWDSLLAGDKKKFQFPFADRASLIELRIKPSSCSYDSDSDQCFKLEMSNIFLRMLAAPIELGYDAELRRLLRYRGLSNIGDGRGGGSMVDIQYYYQDVPALACNIGDQALNEYSKSGES